MPRRVIKLCYNALKLPYSTVVDADATGAQSKVVWHLDRDNMVPRPRQCGTLYETRWHSFETD